MLRRALGADVVLSRGEDELGLDESRLWCDAVAFEEALDAQQLADGLALYRGELLEAFFVSDAAPLLEQWLDRERARLRHRAAEAAWLLAELAAQRRSADSAARWAYRAADLSADDELAVRRLITLFDRLGDRAAALRVYEDFARRLAGEYEAEPNHARPAQVVPPGRSRCCHSST
jgi:DNA-binding SARP family transcriptional activator